MSILHPRRRTAVCGGLGVAAAFVTYFWWSLGRPVELTAAPEGVFQCVSYAPSSERDETLVDIGVVVPPERIARDLRILAGRTRCVRTYSQSNGLAEVPRLARELGLEVLMGVWLGRDLEANEAEIASAIRVAERDGDMLRGIVVGNEVLLRGELPPTALAAYIQRVKEATAKPVTYADVWEFWYRYRESIEGVVDFVTIHILPYWEDEPVAVQDAVAHVSEIYERMSAEFPGKEIMIGETGWPSAGRQRQGALPSTVNQARFVREFLKFTSDAGIRYNLIEAFDQPWKRRQEGTVGGYWGLYDYRRNEKFALQGPVVEEPRWLRGPLAGAGGAALFLLAAAAAGTWRRGRGGDAREAVIVGLTGFLTGAILTFQAETLWQASRSTVEWAVGVWWSALVVVTCWTTARQLGRALQTEAEAAARRHALRVLRFVWLFGASVVALLLVLDSRYRDLPLSLFGLPVAAFVMLSTVAAEPSARLSLEERLLASWLVVAGILGLAVEGLLNMYAWGWSALLLAFAASTLMPPERNPGELTQAERRPA